MATFNFRSRDTRDFRLADRPRPRPASGRDEPATAVPLQAADQTDLDDDGWLMSSYELRRGLRVSEEDIDTLPAELRDAFVHRR